MTVRDLLPMQIDIDVYDDVCEELAIAYCGPMYLTDEGLKEFGEVLDYEITLVPHSYGDMPAYIVHVDDQDDDVWEKKLHNAEALFNSLAGYCSVDDYKRWFSTFPTDCNA